MKAWYSVRTLIKAFGGLSFSVIDRSLGSGVVGTGAGVFVAVFANLWLILLVIPIAKYLCWLWIPAEERGSWTSW